MAAGLEYQHGPGAKNPQSSWAETAAGVPVDTDHKPATGPHGEGGHRPPVHVRQSTAEGGKGIHGLPGMRRSRTYGT